MKTFAVSIAALFIWTACGDGNQPIIDREALVERNSPVVTAFDSLASLSVGNGEFAYTVDITGLQTFPDNYKKGVPLGTQSQWGWHSFANPDRLTPEETLKELDRLAASPFCKAIGEAGLDKFVSTSLSLQRELFVRQAELAAAHRLPVIVHCVKAWDELLSARKDIPAAAVCIIHGFRGKPQLAESLLGKGFYLSFGFRFHPQSLTLCPSDRLFFESDEDPRPVDTLYRTAAELRSCTPEELSTQCWENLVRIGPSSKK